jgi:hypothetical protein
MRDDLPALALVGKHHPGLDHPASQMALPSIANGGPLGSIQHPSNGREQGATP